MLIATFRRTQSVKYEMPEIRQTGSKYRQSNKSDPM